jgi:hypothetical protein
LKFKTKLKMDFVGGYYDAAERPAHLVVKRDAKVRDLLALVDRPAEEVLDRIFISLGMMEAPAPVEV